MPRGWRLGRVSGVDVFVDPSWSVIAVLLVFSEWTAFSDQGVFPGVTGGQALVLAIATSALFFGSVLAHELAHALVSKARGIPVRGITLYLFGGATHSVRAPSSPFDEFLITVVGPVTNLTIGAVLLALHVWAGGIAKPIRVGMIGFLAVENIFLGGFNLLPGFPLDGGRVLRAGVWRATGDQARATRVSARGGQIVAVLLILGGTIWGIRAGNVLLGVWSFLIAFFIFQGASAALGQERAQDLVGRAFVRDVMSPPPPAIDAAMPLGQAIERYLAGHEGEAFPVMDGSRVAGFVSLRTARDVPPDRTVADATVGGRGVVEAEPSERLMNLIARTTGAGASTVLVVEGGRLVGVIEPEDLTRFLRRGLPEGPPAHVPPPPIPPPPDPRGGSDPPSRS